MPTTSNFGWTTPADTDLVKDGAAAIRTLGNGIDTSLVDLKGGTTDQVLAKNSNSDMDFKWVTQNDSDAIQNSIVDAKGDLISATADNTPARLASSGVNGQVLTVDTSTSTGLKWASPSAGFVGVRAYLTNNLSATNGSDNYIGMTSETFDTDAFHSNSTNTSRFTIPAGKAGYYIFIGQILWSGNSSGSRNLSIIKNRTTTLCRCVNTNNSASSGANYDTNGIAYLAEGDYLELYAYQDSGTTLTIEAGDQYTFFTMAYLGA